MLQVFNDWNRLLIRLSETLQASAAASKVATYAAAAFSWGFALFNALLLGEPVVRSAFAAAAFVFSAPFGLAAFAGMAAPPFAEGKCLTKTTCAIATTVHKISAVFRVVIFTIFSLFTLVCIPVLAFLSSGS